MREYWTAKVCIKQENEKTGKVRKSYELYLMEAVSPTDAETKVHQDFEGCGLDFEIVEVKKSKIVKIIE